MSVSCSSLTGDAARWHCEFVTHMVRHVRHVRRQRYTRRTCCTNVNLYQRFSETVSVACWTKAEFSYVRAAVRARDGMKRTARRAHVPYGVRVSAYAYDCASCAVVAVVSRLVSHESFGPLRQPAVQHLRTMADTEVRSGDVQQDVLLRPLPECLKAPRCCDMHGQCCCETTVLDLQRFRL